MKKTITLLLTLCLLLGLLPTEAVAFAGDIYRAGDVTQVKMADGSLSLQNGYVHVTLHRGHLHLGESLCGRGKQCLLLGRCGVDAQA